VPGQSTRLQSELISDHLDPCMDRMPIVAFRKKILDGRVPWLVDFFYGMRRSVFRRRLVNIYTGPATNWFPFYSCFRRVLSLLIWLWSSVVLNLVQKFSLFLLLSWPRIWTRPRPRTTTTIFVVINHAFGWGQVVSSQRSLYQQMSIVVGRQRSVLPSNWPWADHGVHRLYSSIV
jgi:hypothetical protein